MLIWTLFLSAWAGDYKPLCDKVHESDLVIEIQFQQHAVYPTKHREKEWAPPESELIKTAKTGVVSTVFKGQIKRGTPWKPAWGARFDPGEPSVQEWTKFFELDSFKQIFFFRQSGERFSSTGWAEESAGCNASAHRSWCKDYARYQEQILACLAGKTPPVPTPF